MMYKLYPCAGSLNHPTQRRKTLRKKGEFQRQLRKWWTPNDDVTLRSFCWGDSRIIVWLFRTQKWHEKIVTQPFSLDPWLLWSPNDRKKKGKKKKKKKVKQTRKKLAKQNWKYVYIARVIWLSFFKSCIFFLLVLVFSEILYPVYTKIS